MPTLSHDESHYYCICESNEFKEKHNKFIFDIKFGHRSDFY